MLSKKRDTTTQRQQTTTLFGASLLYSEQEIREAILENRNETLAVGINYKSILQSKGRSRYNKSINY